MIRREVVKEDFEEPQRYRQIVVCVGDNEPAYPRRTFAVFKPRDAATLEKVELSVAEDVAGDITNYEDLELIGSGSNVVAEMFSSGSWTKGVPKDMGTLNAAYKNIAEDDVAQLRLGTGSGGANKTLRCMTVHLTYSPD